MRKYNAMQKIWAVVLTLVMVIGMLPNIAMPTEAASVTGATTVADPGTAYTWESMMGTSEDGNRYAGRVWTDKSVYKEGDTAVLNTRQEVGSSFEVSLADGEDFQVIFSALGSSTNVDTTRSTSGPVDVVLVLDTSTSMDDKDSQGVTRLERTITAANDLLADLLELNDVRIAIVTYNKDSETVLPLKEYTNGIKLVVTNYDNDGSDDAGVVTAYDNSNSILGHDSGYTQGTNLQSGIDRGFNILANAADMEGRAPVAIVLTDGQANRASQEGFYEIVATHADKDGTGASGRNLYLSTLLNAAYTKTKIEEHYNTDATVYTVGVDVSTNQVARLLMNPADTTYGFYATSTNRDIRNAYSNFLSWTNGQTVTYSGWTFDHNYPTQNGAITAAKIAANIYYADTYYDVSNATLGDAFAEIVEELSSGIFNPITDTVTGVGATGVQDTPLIYADNIGQYMEVKDIQAITLFGNSYDVVYENGAYHVEEATGTNPTTGEEWNTKEDIQIEIRNNSDGTQQLRIYINQEILPILLDQVEVNETGDSETAELYEFSYAPLRVYYTIGVDSDILNADGTIDFSKIASDYAYIDSDTGEITFYANDFGGLNTNDLNSNGLVELGDAHVGFVPSPKNRYYYHQTQQEVFKAVTRKDGTPINWEADEYGIRWEEDVYDLDILTYADFANMEDSDQVYTYVTFYRPTGTGTGSAAEEVTYLVFTTWGDLKESIGLYDDATDQFLNDGKAIAEEDLARVTADYDSSKLLAILGQQSRRVSRLHNMFEYKGENATESAELAYAPAYNDDAHNQDDIHEHSEVIVWLGNNGKLTVPAPETGIALTKAVTEAIGNADDTYALTVTVPNGVTAAPEVKDAEGNTVTASYVDNVLTVNVKAGETVYITGIPAGTECTIGENINGDYYISSQTDKVTVPTLTDVMSGAPYYAAANVTNTPNGYGDLTIIKDIGNIPDNMSDAMANAMAAQVFTFEVDLGEAFANASFVVDAANAPENELTEGKLTANAEGIITVKLKDNESITILDIPEDTAYTVTEVNVPNGYLAGSAQSGTIQKNGDHDVHFVNSYNPTELPVKVQFTITKEIKGATFTDPEEFKFQIQMLDEASGNYVNVGEEIIVANGNIMTEIVERTRTFNQIGTYHFRIIETQGTTPGMTYSSMRALFAVVVTDENADGVLEAAVINEGNTTVGTATVEGAVIPAVDATFVNTYEVGSTYVDIDLYKDLVNNTGIEISKTSFQFGLYKVENGVESTTATYTITAGEQGYAQIRIPVTKLEQNGETYVLREIIPDTKVPGMTYSDAAYTIVLKVVDNGGQLEATYTVNDAAEPNADEGVEATFQNTYTLGAATYTPSAKKVLEATRTMDANEFTFILHQTGSSFAHDDSTSIDTQYNTESGEVTFKELTFHKAGTYYFVVMEQAGTNPGMTYDTTHYHVTVTVGIDPADATKLKVNNIAINKVGTNSGESGQVVFVNSYEADPTEYTIGGKKVLEGRSLAAGEFEFGLYEDTDTTAAPIQVAKNAANGSFSFEAIEYTQPGEYVYTVKEIVPADKLPGVKYADNSYKVTVTVEDNGDGTMSASADVANANITFKNTYKAAPTRIVINGTKTLKGAALADDDFTFALYETDHTFDISGKTPDTTTNKDGAFTFGKTFDKAGTYFFVLVEDASDPMDNVVYDSTQYRFRVVVSDMGDGQLRATLENLTAGTTAYGGETAASTNVSFTNATFDEVTDKEVIYKAAPEISIDGEKVEAGETLTYLITYTNYTGADATVVIHDSIPAHTSYVTGSASHGGSYVGGAVSWRLNVAKGESVTVSFQVKVDETNVIIPNRATVLDGTNSYTTNEVTNHTVEDITEKDVFSVEEPEISIDGQKVAVGDTLLYTVSYVNPSADPATVTITDTIPTHTTYVADSASDNGVYADGALTWNLNVGAWQKVTVSFQVTVDAEDVFIENQAKVVEGNNEYDTNVVTNHTHGDPEKTVFSGNTTTVIDDAVVAPDDVLTYQIHYVNTTGAEAEVAITDTIPAYTTYVEGSASEGGVYANGVVTWTKTLAAQEEITVSFQVKVNAVNAQQTVTNKAQVLVGGNTYDTNEVTNTIPAPVTYQIQAKKEYDKSLKDNKFTFVLKSADNKTAVEQEKQNDDQGNVVFDSISFPKADTYTFTVTEKQDVLWGFISLSKAEYKVTIEVRETNGVLRVVTPITVEKLKGADNENDLTFINNYIMDGEGEVTLTGTKTLTGDRTTVKAEEFTFGLYDANGQLVESVKNDANGNFQFSTLTFDEEDAEINGQKQYKYTVKEIAGTDPYVTYDTSVYDVTVTVKDNDEGGVEVSCTLAKGGKAVEAIAFENTFTNPDPAVITIDVTKTVENKTQPGITAEDFEILLYEGDVQRGSAKTGATGKAGFQITYGLEDVGKTVTYKVMEKKGKAAGVTYDDTVYTVKVTVAAKEDGTLYTVINDKEASSVAVSFKNIYEKPATPVTGDHFPVFLAGGLLLISAAAIAVLLLTKKKSGKYAR